MRVVAGRFGGRVLKSPSHSGLRPTSERVREAVFNILGARIVGARVLDLYAGTGALGIEALSRGASLVAFVERDRRALTLLRGNLSALGLGAGEARVLPGDVPAVLRGLAKSSERFDLILADPPYDSPAVAQALPEFARGLLQPGGLLLVEHRSGESMEPPTGMVLTDRRVYGATTVSIFTAGPGTGNGGTAEE